MPYRPQDLSALSYANGFTLWHYRSTDSAAEIDTTGYFNAAARMLRPGDFILCNSAVGSAPANGVLIVASNDGTTVDVTNLSPLGVLNSD
jgi:hypothetical protein